MNQQTATVRLLIFFFTIAIANTFTEKPAYAQACTDSDGDGWGWTGQNTCIIGAEFDSTAVNDEIFAQCIDVDGDGWGWNGKVSCWLGDARNYSDSSACIDTDADGWGWTGRQSCIVGANSGNTQSSANNSDSTTDNNTQSDTGNYSDSAFANTPVGVSFNYSSLRREGHRGDNWCLTWAADDSQITSMDDGDWLNNQTSYHNMLYRIHGDSGNASISELNGYPAYLKSDNGWYGYGVASIDGVLYSMVSKARGDDWEDGPFQGLKMLRSYDNGNSWSRVDRNGNSVGLDRYDAMRTDSSHSEMFFSQEYGRTHNGREGYPFSYVSFVQNGKDNSASQDGFVYIYSPEGSKAHELMLARVPASQLGNRNAWQYFAGWESNSAARWSSDINQRQANLTLPETNSRGEYFGWYSYLPSVVWNEGLQLYIMANGGTYAGTSLSNSTSNYYSKWMHEKSGSLGLWYARTPHGPWQQFYYNEEWVADNAANRTYQPKLSPKWISDDGKKMVLIWSDAMRNSSGQSHSVNYKWNQMEIDIRTR